MTSKAVERSLALLEVLSAMPRGVEREEIRWRVPGYRSLGTLAAFERTFERDKQVLRALGISLVAERDPSVESGFIYRVERRVPAAPVSFSLIDCAVLNRCARAWEGTDLERQVRSALLKLGTLTGYGIQEDSGEVARFTAGPGLSECLTSLAEGKGVSFSYGASSESRKLFCWGLGLRFGHWYVTGWDADRRERRLFRLDRMSDVKVLALEGPLPPAGFSMIEVLEQLSSAETPHVLTVPLSDDGADSEVQQVLVSPSFGVLESARSALAQGRTHMVGEIASYSVGATIDTGYQAEVARAEEQLRSELLAWHRQTPQLTSPLSPKEWKPIAPQRSRESASEQLVRLLLMVNLVSEKEGMYLAEIADFFDIPERKIRTELENLSYSLNYDSLEVEIRSDGFVTASGRPLITSGVRLTEAESLVLVLALELIASSEASKVYSLLKFKLWSALGNDDQRGSKSLQNRVAVYQADIDAELAYALEHRVPLNITYRSRKGTSSRTIEPVSLVIDNGPKYVKAWCRTAREYRNFSLGSILESRLALGQVYEHQPESDSSSPREWLRELVGSKGAGQEIELVLPSDISGGHREKSVALLNRYSREVAETSQGLFYRLSVVYMSWFFDFLVELGPTVFVLSPVKIQKELVNHIETTGMGKS